MTEGLIEPRGVLSSGFGQVGPASPVTSSHPCEFPYELPGMHFRCDVRGPPGDPTHPVIDHSSKDDESRAELCPDPVDQVSKSLLI